LRLAYALIVVAVFCGPLVFGTHVAETVGTGIVDYGRVGPRFLVAGIAGAIAAVLVAYGARIPTSMSLALVAGMLGALAAGPGFSAVHPAGLEKVAGAMIGSVVIGFSGGAAAFALLVLSLRSATRRTGDRIMRLQYESVALQALGYGANDAEKMIGLIAIAVSIAYGRPFAVPLWIIAIAAGAFTIGMLLGGKRVAKTVGGKLFHIRPEHALAFQLAAGVTVMLASLVGGPLSTTESTASAIVGAGAVANPRMVHWRLFGRFLIAWLFTVPAGFAAGALASVLIVGFSRP